LYTYNTDDQEHPFSNILNYTTTKTITDSIYKASRLFFEANYPDIKEELFFLSFDIAKYFPGGEMTYHTDYDQEQFYKPGLVFHTTVLLYPNDNYDGGEISFIEMDSEENVLWRHDYKPKAGDIVIFNSRPPIYHGVSPNLNAEKYIIRAY
jgi:predicted 2-oxoglutarate/Fe(II)-dependent dioxygenase YbiX